MGQKFNVYLRDSCLVCKKPIDRKENKRMRSYCSALCRVAYNKESTNRRRVDSGWNKEYLRLRNDKKSKVKKEGTLQCIICGGWYARVTSHVRQRHGMTAREYKKELGLAVGRGIITEGKREHLRELVHENGTINNLVSGEVARYKPGDERAKGNSNPWGQNGAPKGEELFS